jgi:hypothetical protein
VEQINFKKMLATLTDQGMMAIIQSNIVQYKHSIPQAYQETGTDWVGTLSGCRKTGFKKKNS